MHVRINECPRREKSRQSLSYKLGRRGAGPQVGCRKADEQILGFGTAQEDGESTSGIVQQK
jgi:hypothetical protein